MRTLRRLLKPIILKSNFLTHLFHFYQIFTDPINRGNRLALVGRFFNWYFLRKPFGKTYTVELENGMKSIVYPDSDSGVGNIISKNVDYYDNILIRNTVKPGDFIVDAGCNVGNRTLVLSDIIGGALMIDANPICIERTKKNFALNGIQIENYHLVCMAVGSKAGEVTFSNVGGTDTTNKILSESESGVENGHKIQMTTIDDEMERLGNPKCTFIKTDVEGYDLEAFKGAIKMFKKGNTRLVKFERWETVSVDDFREFFKPLGYFVFTLDETGKPTLDEEKIQKSYSLFAAPRDSSLYPATTA